MKLAIVTTVADAAEHIDFFINYHLSIGIKHIFIFIDDACEKTFKAVSKYSNVTALIVDEEIKDRWKLVPFYRNFEKKWLRNKEVMVRQEYNAYLAYLMAVKMDIDWLLHIDIDELFFLNGNLLEEHLKKLKRKNAGGCVYLNYEAIPIMTEHDSIYKSTKYFRKNFYKRGKWFFSCEQKNFIDEQPWIDEFFFNYYQNGKSAANIHHEIMIDDVHAMWANGLHMEFLNHDDPIILHFPSATLKEFHKKYERLGKFPDNWKGYPRAGKFINTLHLDARDAYCSGNREDFEKIYKDRIMFDQERIGFLLEKGLALEIEDIVNFELLHIEYKNQINDKKEKPRPNIRNFIVIKKASINNLLPNKILSSQIKFESINLAKKWIRRHPILSKSDKVFISKEGDMYGLIYDKNPMYDFSSDETLNSLSKSLGVELDGCEGLALNLDDIFFSECNDQMTEFDVLVRRIKLYENVINGVCEDKRERIFVNKTGDFSSLFFDCSCVNIMDEKINLLIKESLNSNSTYPLANYIGVTYPNYSKLNWAIYIDESVYDKKKFGAILSVVFSLGGTIICGEEFYSNSKEQKSFIAARDEYPFIKDTYARLLLGEHEQLIILRKEKGNFEFISISNISDVAARFYRNQVVENLDLAWTDLINKDKFTFTEDYIDIKPGQYLWLIAKKDLKRGWC